VFWPVFGAGKRRGAGPKSAFEKLKIGEKQEKKWKKK